MLTFGNRILRIRSSVILVACLVFVMTLPTTWSDDGRTVEVEESDMLDRYTRNIANAVDEVTVQDLLNVRFCEDSRSNGLRVEEQVLGKVLSKAGRTVLKAVGLIALYENPGVVASIVIFWPDDIARDPNEVFADPDADRGELRTAAKLMLGWRPGEFSSLSRQEKAAVLKCLR